LAHGYRTLQHWDHWLTQQTLGKCLLDAEKQILKTLLDRHFGKHATVIGVPSQYRLLQSTMVPCHTLISPLLTRDKHIHAVEAQFHDLPILTGSMDLVVLPHTLELIEGPRQLLAEACRIVKPEGLIVICGFNPYSLWGVRRLLNKQKSAPWTNSFIQPLHIRNWLQLAEFKLEKQTRILYRPPFTHPTLFDKFNFVEHLGDKCFPALGGVYVLLARAKVIPLTPIRLKWKQKLSNIRISTTIPGNIVGSVSKV